MADTTLAEQIEGLLEKGVGRSPFLTWKDVAEYLADRLPGCAVHDLDEDWFHQAASGILQVSDEDKKTVAFCLYMSYKAVRFNPVERSREQENERDYRNDYEDDEEGKPLPPKAHAQASHEGREHYHSLACVPGCHEEESDG